MVQGMLAPGSQAEQDGQSRLPKGLYLLNETLENDAHTKQWPISKGSHYAEGDGKSSYLRQTGDLKKRYVR